MARRRRSFFFDNINKRLLANTTKNVKESKQEADNNTVTNTDFLKKEQIDSDISSSIANLVNSAPSTLNTLDELAAALGDDANFATTTSTSLGNRLRIDTNAQGLTATQKTNAKTNLGLSTVATSGAYSDLTGTPTIPTNNNQLTNGAGYITGITSSNVTSALGYTPANYNHFRHTGTGHYTSTTTSALLTEALGDDAFDSFLTAHKTGWSYAGNGDLTDAGRLTELAGTSWLWWTDNATDNTQGNITALCIAPNTGGSAGKVFIYNNQGSGYSPGWREVWTSTSDGSGSGLDADTVDGIQGSSFMRSDANTSTTGTIYAAGNAYYVASSNNKVKYALWGSGDTTYGMGMRSNYTFGHLNDYAITFQMSNTADRGFWWGDSGHTQAQGAMSLTTGGRLTVATSISVGQGESVTSPSTATFYSGGNSEIVGELNVYRNTGSSTPSYSSGMIEVQTGDNSAPAIGFHRGGYSATTLYENNGELYANAWVARSQTGKLLSTGNIGETAFTQTGTRTMNGFYVGGADGHREKGIYGNYNSYRINNIWSMGTSYKISSAGTGFGNLYGMAYTYHNRVYTSNTMGQYHQMVWCNNGTPYCALGRNVWTSGNVTAYSDIRVKENLEIIPNALEKVSKLNGYTFDRTDIETDNEGNTPRKRQAGVVAQEVLEVLPEVVSGNEDDPDGHLSVAYGNMVGLLIEAIKEQQEQIEELKVRLQ